MYFVTVVVKLSTVVKKDPLYLLHSCCTSAVCVVACMNWVCMKQTLRQNILRPYLC